MDDGRHGRAMTRFGFALCAFALLVLIPAPSAAQPGVPEVIGWEMGIVYAEGEEDSPFVLSEGETSVQFWIRNDNLAGDIVIDLEYQMDVTGDLEGPDSATVSSGRNDTFVLRMTAPDVWSTAAGTLYDFDVQGSLTTFAGIPVLLPSNQMAEGQLVVPALHRWQVDLVDFGHPVSAGTEFNVEVELRNVGNSADAIRDFDLEDDCPVLTVEADELEALMGQFTEAGTMLQATLVYDASSTHPTRICEIELSVRSTRVYEGGAGDASNVDELEVEVEARPVGSQQDNDDASVGDDDGPQNQEEVTSDNFLAAPVLLTPLAIIAAALRRKRSP